MPCVGVSETEENGKKEKWQWGRRNIHKYVAIHQCVEVHGALPVTTGIDFKSGKLNEQPVRKSVY
jgi:hypothetical protein